MKQRASEENFFQHEGCKLNFMRGIFFVMTCVDNGNFVCGDYKENLWKALQKLNFSIETILCCSQRNFTST